MKSPLRFFLRAALPGSERYRIMRWFHGFSVFFLILLLTAGCSSSSDSDETPVDQNRAGTFKAAVCDAGSPSELAFVGAGLLEDGSRILLDGKRISPAGISQQVQEYARGLAMSPDNRYAYILTGGHFPSSDGLNHYQSLDVIDLEAESEDELVVQIIDTRMAGWGLDTDDTGKTVYVPGGNSERLYVYRWTTDPDTNEETFGFDREIKVYGYAGSVKYNAATKRLFVTHPAQSKVTVIDLADNDKLTEIPAGYWPYDIAVNEAGTKAYTSNWSGNNVSVLDLASMKKTTDIPVGKSPEGLTFTLDDAYLLVTSADADEIAVIDTDTDEVETTIVLDDDQPELKFWSPNAISMDPIRSRAYVASADRNAVEVIDTDSWNIVGYIPTAWYPVRVDISPDGSKMVVVNGKGWGNINNNGKHTGQGISSSVQVFDAPDDTKLAEYSAEVEGNNTRHESFFPDNNCIETVPLPLNDSQKSVIEHIVFIIKENKTYDEVMGELPEPDDWDADKYGLWARDETQPDAHYWHDPELCTWGTYHDDELDKDIHNTPNHYKIAQEFSNMLNFYSNAEESVQGHLWVTQGDINDFAERNRSDTFMLPGIDPATFTYNKDIFRHLVKNEVSFRNYGEIVSFGIDGVTDLAKYHNHKYPFWTMSVLDVDKAKEFIREFDQGIFPPFVFMLLPNDHTSGGSAGQPTARTYVADNDHGLGMVVEAISHSDKWEKTLIIVIEDDPQSGPGDHIDAHRSLCFMISPWVKRGYHSTVHYSIPNIFRTIELILDVPPLNRNTLMAVPMYDVFTDQPDLTPYDALVPETPFQTNPKTGRFAEEAAKANWPLDDVDGWEGFSDHMWRLMHGDIPRPERAKRIAD